MASIFGHFAAGYGLSKLVKWKLHWSVPVLAMVSSFIPDIDVIAFRFGIPYEDMFGHRGFTHSIFFAVLWGIIVTVLYGKNRILIFVIIFLATASHPVLDAMTSGGLGVAFFAPFSNERYFFYDELRVIRVSPLGIKNFISSRGLVVLKSELIWIVAPVSIVLIIKYLLRGRNRV